MGADTTKPSIPFGEQTRSPTPILAETALSGRELTERSPSQSADVGAREWVGKTLGKYQIHSVLGQGGMGVVLKAHDAMIERDVAVKLLAGQMAGDPASLNRFLSEAKAVGKLNHPNVAAIYEIGQEGTTHFLVMEYISGGSLSDQLAKHGPLSPLEATQAMIDACKGIAAAHSAGLVHRDLKPGNLMRAADGSVKVMDFGLAKGSAQTTHQLTQTGLVVGTPYFMSPEQCEAKPVDARSDLYSLGATYFSLLTGRNPYQETDSVPQLLYFHCHGPVPDPRTVFKTVPQACAQIIARAMAKSPGDRYQSADEMLADLQAVAATLSGQSGIPLPSQTRVRHSAPTVTSTPTGRRTFRLPVMAGLVLLAAAVVAGVVWRPWQKSTIVPEGGTGVLPPAGEPIKVGVLHSMSGTMSNSETVVVDSVMFGIDEINQAGGVLGRPIKAVVADGRSDWPTFAREAERLITEENVATVFGCWTSASRKTVKPIFEKHDHLLLYPLQYEGIETSPNIVYLGAAPNQQIIPAIQWAVKSLNKKRFFLVGSDYVFPRTANEVIKDHLKGLGAEVAGEEYVPLGSPDVQHVVAAIAKSKPDMILNTINGDSNTAFFRALRAAGFKPSDIPTLSFSVGEQELRSLNLADMVGDFAAWTYFESVPTPENKEFVRRFHEKYPQRSLTDPMEAAYVGVKMWAKAVEEAQSLDPKKIRRALLNQRFAAPGGEVRIDADTQHCYKTPRIGQIQSDGQFKILWTAPEPVQPQPYPSTRMAAEWRAFLHDLYTGWGNRWAAPDVGPRKQ